MGDSLGDRMKGYEDVNRLFLTRRTPTIIRLDGKAFHTFTKDMEKPFDNILIETMQDTAKHLCENIQGCKMAYTQSDEISLLLTDYEKITTDSWFDKNIQKMVSVSASMATLAFNKSFMDKVHMLGHVASTEDLEDYFDILEEKINTALFDSRVFNIPKEEVCNYFIWRQQDCTRNSIQMVGQSEFSHKKLHGKSCDQIQDMLFTESGINWNDFNVNKKRGSSIIKAKQEKEVMVKGTLKTIERNIWEVDFNTPVFSQDRDYIEKNL